MSTGNVHLLPDSRLKDPVGSMMVDWVMPNGKTVRIEVERIYCGNCGKFFGHCPRDNTTFLFWCCNKCFEKRGLLEGEFSVPEDDFNRAVAAEMEARFGKHLTDVELVRKAEAHELGRALELLERESPYKVANR